MVVLTGVVQPQALEVIHKWDLEEFLNSRTQATYEQYLNWLKTGKNQEDFQNRLAADGPAPGIFYLSAVREDGYREYAL